MTILSRIRLYTAGAIHKILASVYKSVLESIKFRIDRLEEENANEEHNEALRELYGLYFHIEKAYNGYSTRI